jgi:thermitase
VRIKRSIALIWVVLILLGLGLVGWLPVAPARAASCPELIVNGGFESGSAPWQTSSAGGYALFSQVRPRTGSWGAYLGGYNNADDQLSQEVTLPAGTQITLRFWWQMSTEETSHPWDTLDIAIIPNGVDTPTRLLQITDGDIAGSWQEAILDLSPFAGQGVRLAFRARTDQDRPTDFFLDDASIVACAAPTHVYLPLVKR